MTCNQNVSPREREVLKLIAYEHTTKEIASRLCISTHTADSHRKNLMQKLNVKNTAGLVRIGFQSGLLRLSPILLLIFLLGFQDRVSAGHTIWTGAASDHNWFNATNWDNGVPMAGDSATISTDSIIINNATGIAQLILINGARLVVTPSGTLGLDNGAIGIECTDSKIYNYGNIAITTPVSRGIELLGASLMDNFPGSSVVIGQSLTNGAFHIAVNSTMNIRNNSVFVSFQNPTNSTNLGELKNRGILRIIETQTHALDNSGIITNRGLIEIDSTLMEGIINEVSGKIDNYDTIRVTRFGDDAILNLDSLVNQPNGYIDIADAGQGLPFDGIHNTNAGITINDGMIRMENVAYGVNNSGNFFNRNKLLVSNATNLGLLNLGLFTNANDAYILFSNMTGNSSGAMSNVGSGFILNEGKLEINDSRNYGIRNDSYIYNLDTIDISDTDGVGIINNDSLDNFTTGYIHIHDLKVGSEYGLENTGTLTNEGNMRIYNVPEIGLRNTGNMINEEKIKIDSTGDSGILNEDGGVINNSDSLVISRVSDALEIYAPILNSDSIANHSDGVILIENSSNFNAIRNVLGGSIINHGSLIVHGTISGISHIGNMIRNFGLIDLNCTSGGILLSKPLLINEDSGRIIMGTLDGVLGLGDGIKVLSGPALVNYGYIEMKEGFREGVEIFMGRVDNYDSLIINTPNAFSPILNRDTFYNHTSGVVVIDHTSSNLSVTRTVFNKSSGYLHNAGIMQVNSGLPNCLINEGVLVNDSLLIMGGLEKGIINNGSEFINNVNGRIEIRTDGTAIKNDSVMMNLGTILIEDVGSAITNNGMLINGDSIIVQGICTAGITNYGKIENQIGASIISTTDVPFGIDNKDTLQNDGFIFIDNPDTGIRNEGYLVNQDSVSIRDNRVGLDNNMETSTFINNGGLHIFEAVGSERGILANGSIVNNGSITIRDQMIEILATGTIDNNIGAMLSVILGEGSIESYLLIQTGGILNGFPIIDIGEGEE